MPSPLTNRLIKEGCAKAARPATACQAAAVWRRGMMHAVERLDLVLAAPTRRITRANALAVLEDVRRTLDEITEFQRHATPGSYEQAFDLCSADLKRAREERQGVKLRGVG